MIFCLWQMNTSSTTPYLENKMDHENNMLEVMLREMQLQELSCELLYHIQFVKLKNFF